MKKILFLLVVFAGINLTTYGQKFAYVNTDYLLDNLPEYKDAQKTLDGLSVNWQKEIENKYTEIDKMYKSYQAEQILLTEDMKKKREQEIVNKEKEVKDLQKQRFGKDGDLFRKRQELVKPLQDKVYNAIKKLATDGSYAVIFDKTSEAITMLYTNPKYDKSDDVLKIMGITPGPKKSTTGAGSGSGTGTGGGTGGGTGTGTKTNTNTNTNTNTPTKGSNDTRPPLPTGNNPNEPSMKPPDTKNPK